MINFMNVDVAYFFFLEGERVGLEVGAFCLGVFNRKGNHRKESQELDWSLNDHSRTGSHLFFLPPEFVVL